MRSILNSHSDISLVNEPEIISSLRRCGFRVVDCLSALERRQFLSVYANTYFGKRHLSSLSGECIKSFLQLPGNLSFAKCFESLLPKPRGHLVWGEKSLSLGFYLCDIVGIYPELIAVSMIRDPRAAILSLYRKRKLRAPAGQPKFTLKTFNFFLYQSVLWCEWVKEADAAKKLLGEERVYEVRFEDFLLEPERFARSLCSSIGVNFETRMLDKANRKDDPVAVPDFAYAHGRLTEDLSVERAAAGSELCPWATLVVESVCAKTMTEHRYAPSVTRLNFWRRKILHGLLSITAPKIRKKVMRDVARHRNVE